MQRFISQLPQLVPGRQDDRLAAAPAKKNSGMICKIQVRAWNTTEVVSRLSQISTWLRMTLMAITV